MITIYDPMFIDEEGFHVKCSESLCEAVKNIDCIVVDTGHKEFKNLDFTELAQLSHMPAALVKARHVVDPHEVARSLGELKFNRRNEFKIRDFFVGYV